MCVLCRCRYRYVCAMHVGLMCVLIRNRYKYRCRCRYVCAMQVGRLCELRLTSPVHRTRQRGRVGRARGLRMASGARAASAPPRRGARALRCAAAVRAGLPVLVCCDAAAGGAAGGAAILIRQGVSREKLWFSWLVAASASSTLRSSGVLFADMLFAWRCQEDLTVPGSDWAARARGGRPAKHACGIPRGGRVEAAGAGGAGRAGRAAGLAGPPAAARADPHAPARGARAAPRPARSYWDQWVSTCTAISFIKLKQQQHAGTSMGTQVATSHPGSAPAPGGAAVQVGRAAPARALAACGSGGGACWVVGGQAG